MKGNLFRIPKQLVRNNKDVVGSGRVKDSEVILLLMTRE